MWSDQRLISNNDSDGDHSPEFAECSELTRVLRCVGATETEPGRSGERKEGASGDAEAAACVMSCHRRRRRLVPAGCRRLGLATSFKSRKNLGGIYSKDCPDYPETVQII